jgi:thiosulfate/3-mercaptopyruvate sulfurtransferase
VSGASGGERGGGTVSVSTDWLAAHLDDPALRVVDIRGQVRPPGSKPRYVPKPKDYAASHVPGAVFVDWTRDIVDPDDPVPSQIARADAFAARMTALGIGDDTLVVAYDDYNHIFAGRLAWALRYYGHDAARILDGGWKRWTAEGRATTREVPAPKPPPKPFTARPRLSLRVSADEVEASLGKPDVLLLDARPADQYAGTVSAAGRGGHIPGARNVHYAALVDPATGRLRSTDELTRTFAQAGVDVTHLPPRVIVYCNGGISCTVPLHALQMLGRADVAVYDGSWNEWGPDERRPIQKGREP